MNYNLLIMKIGVVLAANIYFSPYVQIYLNIMDTHNIKYEIIYWDREQLNEKAKYIYTERLASDANSIIKLRQYYKYSRFVINTVKNEKYKKLIIFGAQLAIFLKPFLKRNFHKSFILDYRDLSIDQILKRRFRKVLEVSSLNVISSPGFKKVLPSNFSYVLSHNIDINEIEDSLDKTIHIKKNPQPIKILTIGAIRDYDQNIEIVNALANNKKFEIQFVGKGPDSEKIKQYVAEKHVMNVKFVGFYSKKDEAEYIKESDYINIYYPKKLSHETALSNRFYNSIRFGKPMITTSHSVQGDYAVKFHLGISIDNTEGLAEKLISYISQLDHKKYDTERKKIMDEFRQDYFLFEQEVLAVLTKV